MEPNYKDAYYNPDQNAERPKPIYSWSTIANDTEILGVSLDDEDDHVEWGEVFVAGKEEAAIDRITRSLRGDIVLSSVYNTARLILPENCYLQSDSASSLTSSSSRISDPEDLNLGNICGCLCVQDQLGYLLEASDEELGIPTSPTYVDFDKMIDFNIEDDNCFNVESGFQEFAKIESSFYLEELVDLEFCEVANFLCNDGHTTNGSLSLMLEKN